MWKALRLKTFKAFKDITVPLGPLTIFSGVNSAGKSSFLQALAVLNQTISDNEFNNHLCISSSNVNLGTIEDVANRDFSRNCFGIGLTNENATVFWSAESKSRGSTSPEISEVQIENADSGFSWLANNQQNTEAPLYRLIPQDIHLSESLSGFIGEIANIKYLSAERLGPREVYPSLPNPRIRSVGPNGEYTAAYIDRYGNESATIHLTESQDVTIRKCIDEFLDSFFPGYSIDARKVERTGLYSLLVLDPFHNPHRPHNVGYGISHTLPIISLCAGSKPGDTLLIESPESYLHPALQSRMGQFLAMTASEGVQVIIETHSDHVLNGIRVAVARRKINAENVCVNFVSKPVNAEQPINDNISLTPEGRMTRWPHGFFDQIEQDLMSLP